MYGSTAPEMMGFCPRFTDSGFRSCRHRLKEGSPANTAKSELYINAHYNISKSGPCRLCSTVRYNRERFHVHVESFFIMLYIQNLQEPFVMLTYPALRCDALHRLKTPKTGLNLK